MLPRHGLMKHLALCHCEILSNFCKREFGVDQQWANGPESRSFHVLPRETIVIICSKIVFEILCSCVYCIKMDERNGKRAGQPSRTLLLILILITQVNKTSSNRLRNTELWFVNFWDNQHMQHLCLSVIGPKTNLYDVSRPTVPN